MTCFCAFDLCLLSYVVSASPELYVRNAAESLGLPRERFRGIRATSVMINGGQPRPGYTEPL